MAREEIIFRPYLSDYLSDNKSAEWLPKGCGEEYTPAKGVRNGTPRRARDPHRIGCSELAGVGDVQLASPPPLPSIAAPVSRRS